MKNNINKEILDNQIEKRLFKYKGTSTSYLIDKFYLNAKSKSINQSIIMKILDIDSLDINSFALCKNLYVFKTIRINENNKIKESMSFPAIKFSDLINNEWLDSEIYKYFSTKTFIIFIFRMNKNEDIFADYIPYKLSKENLFDIKNLWLTTKKMIINDELKIGGKNGCSVENFPKLSNDDSSFHIRPHDTDSKDGKVLLPNGKKIINYSFWLNKKYIEKILKDKGVLDE